MHKVNHSPELIKQMKEFVNNEVSKGNIIDDDWFSFNDTIDINIWNNEGEIRAAAYDVIGGCTNTDSWTQLLPA